jgi:hypothetical protein
VTRAVHFVTPRHEQERAHQDSGVTSLRSAQR